MRRLTLLTAAIVALLIPSSSTSAQMLQPFGGQVYQSPRYVAGEPGDPSRVYVVEAAGRIRLVENGVTHAGSFLDISDDVCDSGDGCGGESGMFSIAFAPDYATSDLFYVFFTRAAATQHDLVIREFRRTTNPNDVDEGTGRDVLVIPHPDASNHNGGQLQFGPDGYLYIATGDGGGANDPAGNAQNLDSLLGKLLRIDPTGAAELEHAIPPDNPFAGGTQEDDQVYAYGLRNPYRFSFDRLTGDLTIGDVGQAAWEEIDFVPTGGAAGANFGWDCFEGTAVATSGTNGEPQCTPLPPNHTPPVLQYANPPGPGNAAVIGGYVVRDTTVPSLLGRYLYADTFDALGDQIFSAHLFAGGSSGNAPTGMMANFVVSFGEDALGRIYVVHGNTVSRIQQSAPEPCCAPPLLAAADTTAPGLAVDARKARRSAARGKVTLLVRCDEACTVRGEGKIILRGRDIRLDPDSTALGAQALGALHLELSRKQARRLWRALLAGRKPRAAVELVAADSAGNQGAHSRRIRQKR